MIEAEVRVQDRRRVLERVPRLCCKLAQLLVAFDFLAELSTEDHINLLVRKCSRCNLLYIVEFHGRKEAEQGTWVRLDGSD